jgi:hypothetical protein
VPRDATATVSLLRGPPQHLFSSVSLNMMPLITLEILLLIFAIEIGWVYHCRN